MTELKRPTDGIYCYSIHIFDDSGWTCPDYDDTESINPKCKRFCKTLAWTNSGRVLRLEKCKATDRTSEIIADKSNNQEHKRLDTNNIQA